MKGVSLKKFIQKVAVTGADDSVTPNDLELIAREFPFVEFGILVSPKLHESICFPSKGWIAELVTHFRDSMLLQGGRVAFAGHICGSWVNGIFNGVWPHEGLDCLSNIVTRWQLNTHGIHRDFDIVGLKRVVREQNNCELSKEVIFQFDHKNTGALFACSDEGLIVSALFDLSHGKGRLPSTWPLPIKNIPCGYAGGLSLNNVAEEIAKIEKKVGEAKVWIDAESQLRTNNGSQFDLHKVHSFLSKSKPWVCV